MSVQRVGGTDVTSVVMSRGEVLVALTALRELRKGRRLGAHAPTLGALVDLFARAAHEFVDRDADIPTGRPRPRSGHPAATGDRPGASSGPSSHSGSARTLSTTEVAEHLGLSRRHVRRLIGMGLLDAVVADGRGTYAIDPTSVTVWAAQRTLRKGA